ncbi:hypothetical protein [Chondromyces apiculatus]|nr:hypothetical protein [Chondromyces apiculatus]
MAEQKRAREIEPGILGATDVPGQPWDKPFGDAPGLPLHRPKPKEATDAGGGGEGAGEGEGESGEGGASGGAGSEVMEKARRENRALEEATSTEADRRGEEGREGEA